MTNKATTDTGEDTSEAVGEDTSEVVGEDTSEVVGEDTGDAVDWDKVPQVTAGAGEVFKFAKIGDAFFGKYEGEITIDSEKQGELKAHAFTNSQGDSWIVWASYDLHRKLTDTSQVGIGATVRIEYVKDIDTSRGQTPMKLFKVQAVQAQF